MNTQLRIRLIDLLNNYASDLRVRIAAANDQGRGQHVTLTRLELAEVEATIADLHKLESAP
jgi:hypothetical protein